MDKNKQYKIALVIKTEGLEYDDRVRKEILTVQNLYPNIKFKIFVMIDGDNTCHEGVTAYGVPYKSIELKHRYHNPTTLQRLRMLWELYRVVEPEVRNFDAVWCGDRHIFSVPMFTHNKRILWDLHELPYEMMGNPIFKLMLKYIIRRCKVVLHVNNARCEYMINEGCFLDRSNHFILRNFPNFEDVDNVYDEKYHQFVDWKADRKCIYLQGLNNDGRSAYESVEVIMKSKELAAVVVGSYDQNSLARLKHEWGDDLAKRIFFAGKIAQMKIPQYVKECYASMIFYKNIRANNYYCEANRFYQSVIMGLPVVVGSNPPMKELVDKYGFGVAIEDDGSDVAKIEAGLNKVLSNYDEYHQNNLLYRDNLLWNKQENTIKQIIEKLLS